MSDSMNPYLAAMYNTHGAAETVNEDMQKQANAELFCKLAADQGLDLSQMSDDQIASVYSQVFPEDVAKYAEEDKKKEHEEKESEEKEEKEEKAAAYVEEKKAFVEKCAEADYMGRIMAHAFTQEKDAIELGKEAGLKDTAKGAVEKVKRFGSLVAGGETKKLKGSMEQAKAMAKRHAGGGYARTQEGSALKDLAEGMVGKKAKELAEEAGKVRKARIGAGAGAAGAAALGAGAAALHGKKKEGSAEAFDELAANHAIKVAEAAGYDVDEAVERVSAVFTLGLNESEKIAYVNDIDTATHVRALEFLEAASYPVNWEEVFGS